MTDLFVALTAVGGAWLATFVVFQTAVAWRQWRGLVERPPRRGSRATPPAA